MLGFSLLLGPLMRLGAALGSLSLAPILLYAAAIAWVVGYDTIYALQDIEDDEIAGIKSAARLFGAQVRPAIGACYALAVILIAGALATIGRGRHRVAGPRALRRPPRLGRWRRSTPPTAPRSLSCFRANRDAGLILFLGLCLDALL